MEALHHKFIKDVQSYFEAVPSSQTGPTVAFPMASQTSTELRLAIGSYEPTRNSTGTNHEPLLTWATSPLGTSCVADKRIASVIESPSNCWLIDAKQMVKQIVVNGVLRG